jgi:hypothetical protein
MTRTLSPITCTTLALFVAACDEPSPADKQRMDDHNYILDNQDRLKNRLKDPESAQFRNVFISSISGKRVVCGEVNARNSYGGLMGFERFVAAPVIQVTESSMEAYDFAVTWEKFCIDE